MYRTSLPQKTSLALLDLCRRAFGGWRGRKARINIQQRPKRLLSYWDGGSKDSFVLINLSTREVRGVAANAPFGPPAADYVAQQGWALMEHSVFCGKDSGCTVWLHPDDAEVWCGKLGMK